MQRKGALPSNMQRKWKLRADIPGIAILCILYMQWMYRPKTKITTPFFFFIC